MNCTLSIRKIPLDRLVLSPVNVRKTPASAAEDAELKASIRAGGLKQNLIVHPSAEDASVFAATTRRRGCRPASPMPRLLPPTRRRPSLTLKKRTPRPMPGSPSRLSPARMLKTRKYQPS